MKSRDFFKSFPGTPQQKKVIEKQQKLTLKLFLIARVPFCRKIGTTETSRSGFVLIRNQLWLESKICWYASGQLFFSTESASESFQPVRTRTKFDFVKKVWQIFLCPALSAKQFGLCLAFLFCSIFGKSVTPRQKFWRPFRNGNFLLGSQHRFNDGLDRQTKKGLKNKQTPRRLFCFFFGFPAQQSFCHQSNQIMR